MKQNNDYCIESVKEYIHTSDWRVKANANTGYSHAGLINNLSGKMIANFWLSEVFTEEAGDAHREGKIHIHDLDCLSGYCAGWSLRQLLNEGFNGVRGRIDSSAPSHFNTALGQMVNFLGILQSEWAGAQAFSSFDTYLAPYVFKDNLTYEDVLKYIRSFIYNLNVPSRWGQSPFTNVTIDWTVPNDLAPTYPTKNDEHLFEGIDDDILIRKARCRGVDDLTDLCYKHFQKEMNMINKAFYTVLTEGDLNNQPFTFPIPTVNITENFDWDGENVDLLFENTAKVGSSYFQNFVGSKFMIDDDGNKIKNPNAISEGDVRSMCVIGDSIIDVKLKGSSVSKKMKICDVLDNYDICDIKIKTSHGYREIDEKFIYEIDETVIKTTMEDDIVLITTKDHPHLIYKNDKTLQVVKAEFLQPGMECSCKTGQKSWNKENKKISESIKIGSKQSYWDRKDFKYNNKQISPAEKIIYDELKSIGNEFIYQKVFSDNDMTYVADFYIPSKNIILELESNCDDKVYINERTKMEHVDKFDYYRKCGYDVIIFNAEKCNTYRSIIDKTVKILNVEEIPYKGKVYDVKIKQCKSYTYNTHNFYVNEILTHNCCRLQLDLRELLKRGGGLFGSAEMTGSIGVVTVNMARLGYLYKNDMKGLYNELDILLDMSYDTLNKRRSFVEDMFEKGLYPYSKRYLRGFNNHFSTIGVNGMNEMIRNFTDDKYDITDKEGKLMSIEILDHIRNKMIEYQEKSGHLFNLEATPGEGTCYRFAKEDKKRYPEILQAGFDDNIYYTNSSQIPVDHTDDPFDAMNLQDDLQCKYTGGTVFHLYMKEKISKTQACKTLVKHIINSYRMPYITITPVFSICPKHGYLNGEHDYCPLCDQEILLNKH